MAKPMGCAIGSSPLNLRERSADTQGMRPRLTYSNVMSTLAFMLALGRCGNRQASADQRQEH